MSRRHLPFRWMGATLGHPNPPVHVDCAEGSVAVPDGTWVALAVAELRDRYGRHVVCTVRSKT